MFNKVKLQIIFECFMLLFRLCFSINSNYTIESSYICHIKFIYNIYRIIDNFRSFCSKLPCSDNDESRVALSDNNNNKNFSIDNCLR